MFPSVRFLSLFCVLPALALGCAADDDGSVDVTEDDLTASLGTQALWLVPNGAEPKDDLIHAIAPQGGNKARVVYSYPAETIIRTSCLGTFKFVGTGASKTLQITCPSSTQPMVFSVTKSSTGRLELTTPKLKKSFVLQAPGKVKGDVSLSCVSDAFTAQVEIVGAGSLQVQVGTGNELAPAARVASGFQRKRRSRRRASPTMRRSGSTVEARAGQGNSSGLTSATTTTISRSRQSSQRRRR